VEAAVLLPTLMLVFAILLEPVCMGYTLTLMASAAAETARAATTDYDGSFDDCRSFVIRRLRGVPDVALFHVGGDDDWEVEIERGEHEASVRVRGHARPLPLMGVLASAFAESDETGVVLRVEVHESSRPEWLGGSYADWQKIWG
jgi:hypothetical protein